MRHAARLAAVPFFVFCFAGMLPGAAQAKALHLTYGGTTLLPGQEVEGFDNAWELESTTGGVSCTGFETDEGFLGKDESNGAKTDTISVERVFGPFSSNTECNSSVAGFQPTTRGVWFNAAENSFEVKGKLKLTASGKGEYVSSGAQDTIIALEAEEGIVCLWEVKKLKGTLAVPLSEGISISFSHQRLKFVKALPALGFKSAASCPRKMTLSTTVVLFVPLGGGAEAILVGSVS
jgi:hypothetical protein